MTNGMGLKPGFSIVRIINPGDHGEGVETKLLAPEGGHKALLAVYARMRAAVVPDGTAAIVDGRPLPRAERAVEWRCGHAGTLTFDPGDDMADALAGTFACPRCTAEAATNGDMDLRPYRAPRPRDLSDAERDARMAVWRCWVDGEGRYHDIALPADSFADERAAYAAALKARFGTRA